MSKLEYFKPHLDKYTELNALDHAASRYESIKFAFDHFKTTGGKIVVELGTIRSFTHEGIPGCGNDDSSYWTPDLPENWDWGAGCFSRVAAECLVDLNPMIYTVDISKKHIERCKIITRDFAYLFQYVISDSVKFLDSIPPHTVDLLYVDTGDINEPTALHQLREAFTVVKRDILTEKGIIVLDDVKNSGQKKVNPIPLGKSKYSIPFLLSNGYDLVFEGFQYILSKKKNQSYVEPKKLPWLHYARERLGFFLLSKKI